MLDCINKTPKVKRYRNGFSGFQEEEEETRLRKSFFGWLWDGEGGHHVNLELLDPVGASITG